MPVVPSPAACPSQSAMVWVVGAISRDTSCAFRAAWATSMVCRQYLLVSFRVDCTGEGGGCQKRRQRGEAGRLRPFSCARSMAANRGSGRLRGSPLLAGWHRQNIARALPAACQTASPLVIRGGQKGNDRRVAGSRASEASNNEKAGSRRDDLQGIDDPVRRRCRGGWRAPSIESRRSEE